MVKEDFPYFIGSIYLQVKEDIVFNCEGVDLYDYMPQE